MASLADEKGMNGGPARAPISMHPAFPFIVALWFAALLGIGSLVVPVALVEQLSVASGLASIFPPATPPLGFTARALMALTFTAGGALAGLAIARQVAKAHRSEPVSRFAGSPVLRTPISAIDELGSEGLDGRMLSGSGSGYGRGRRALAIEPEEGPSEFLEIAPLPGAHRDTGLSAWMPENTPAEDELAGEESANEDLVGDDFAALELTDAMETDHAIDMAQPDRAATVPPHDFGRREARPGFTTFDDESGYSQMDDRQFFQMPHSDAGTGEDQEFLLDEITETEPQAAPMPRASVAYNWTQDDEAPADALAFSPPSLAREEPAAEDFGPAAVAEDDEPDTQWEPQFVDHRQFDDCDEEALIADEVDGREDARQLDDLGLVQLAQRLGSSIERRRQLRAARAALAAVAAPPSTAALRVLDEDIDVAAPDEAAEAMAAWFSRPQAATQDAPVIAITPPGEDEPTADMQPAPVPAPIPAPIPAAMAASAERQVFQPAEPDTGNEAAAYRPLSGFAHIDIDVEDEDEDDDMADLAASFTLPLTRNVPASAMAPADPEEQALQADDPLAGLRNPFHERPQAFVRIEDEPEADHIGEPAVVFPAQAPAAVPQPIEQAPFTAPPAAARPLNTEEHERALREALLSLQRMSGAA